MHRRQPIFRSLFGLALVAALLSLGRPASAQQPPLTIDTAKVTIAGTSNVYDFTATTASARVTRARIAGRVAGPAFWDEIQTPGALEAFDLAIDAATLESVKTGLNDNLHKALETDEHPRITFSLKRMEGRPGALKAIGLLQIAGIERDVTLPLKTVRAGDRLAVSGELDILMNDWGIEPPTAMLGMVRADPKIRITFELLLAITAS